ncbi:N,N-dimethylformamidase beta subunit family domain-containing protein [Massilia sp. TSP1-1-2]|uniref:N,N-dimethylformamidase beta subunit family domain-containing protein n=1 Tax=Massilia sp. TSP1-1-2 TaxID=2804649 RepID=UPI003CEDE3AF
MIHGYAASASVWPGQRLVLHVSTDATRFRVGFYRWAGKLVHMFTSSWVDGERACERGADQDWQWPAYGFALPAGWPSGAYIAHLEEPGAGAPHVALRDAAVLFVVRGYGAVRLLYKIPLATYNAYNFSGGGCYYANPPRSSNPPGARLSFHRPGGGVGGPTFGAPDYYDAASPRQTFAHWDARFIGWLLHKGYTPEFCTDLDIHADPGLLRDYRLLLSVGHDEYWSEAMRDGVEGFIGRGGNAAFFSANLCWWRIHLVDGASAMVCHQGGPHGALDHWWPASGAGRPEDALAGVSYRHGGGWWDGPRETAGFAVQDPDHWIFAGTGLRRGECFGADTIPPLAGYECDGAPLAAFDHASGLASLAPDARQCGTPAGLTLLAACPLDARWQESPLRETCAAAGGVHAATMSIFTRGGTVFSAGTTDWAQVLGSGQDERVDTMTGNVIDGLMGRCARPHCTAESPEREETSIATTLLTKAAIQ